MGTIRNEMTIVHDWNRDKLEKVREDAIRVFNQIARQDAGVEIHIENMVNPIMNSYINREYTFVINGDCSKIGWETSERFHEARMKWCEKHKHDVQNIIVINFGEDELCRIVFDSMAIKALKQKTRKGQWLRISNEQEDDRYKCSRCGNVIHYKNEMDLYTFNSWCGRCGSDNGRFKNVELEPALEINDDIKRGFEEFTKMMFKQGQAGGEKE